MISESTARRSTTLRSGHRYPGLLRFLVGRVFYTDAINTVIAYMSLYTVNVAVATGLTRERGEVQAQIVMLVGDHLRGRRRLRLGLGGRSHRPKRTLTLVLWLWLATFALAAAIGAFQLPIAWMFVVASMAGIALGGTWPPTGRSCCG